MSMGYRANTEGTGKLIAEGTYEGVKYVAKGAYSVGAFFYKKIADKIERGKVKPKPVNEDNDVTENELPNMVMGK